MSLFTESNNDEQSSPSTPTILTCTYCEATFPSRSQLFKHLNAQHDLEAQLLEHDKELPLNSSEGRTAASIAARSLNYNVAHDAYYRAQALQANVFSLQDWDEAQHYFKLPLPVAFRMLSNDNNNDEDDVRFAFQQLLETLVPPNSLRSCPALGDLAQTAIIPTRQWSPEAQQALMDAQEVGFANRQELCSMIPPLLLLHNLQPPSTKRMEKAVTVLDLCAAPGSKSLQLMDQLLQLQQTRNNNKNNDNGKHTAATTMLVCNDANRQRLLTVARRSRRFPALGRQSMILNSSDGRYFPALRKFRGYKVKFDGVLADVPCSGDGTLRKLSSKEWQQWNVKSHLQLHALQVRLLTRALECVKKGGRVVYSTCSLDPLEDEAVVVTAMARLGGPTVYRILPIPDKLSPDATESLKYSPGATNWIVPHPQFGKPRRTKGKDNNDDAATEATTHHDETFVSFGQVPSMLRKKDIRPSMFAPRARTEEALASHIKATTSTQEDFEKQMDLARKYGEILYLDDMARYEAMLPNCARILPQHLDNSSGGSGGFFCAIIERVAPEFYPVCYPLERQRREDEEANRNNLVQKFLQALPGWIQKRYPEANGKKGDGNDPTVSPTETYKYHGRVLTNVESAQHMRELLVKDKAQGDEVIFEGVATQELAIQWVHKHRAFIPSISEQLLEAPPSNATTNDSDDERDAEEDEEKNMPNHKTTPNRQINDPTKSVMYTRLFPPPDPSLVAEFCDFFGLMTCPREAAQAGVEVFPAERLAVSGGGGDEAVNIKTCLDPDKAHIAVPRPAAAAAAAAAESKYYNEGLLAGGLPKKIPRKRRFFQLILVSEELRNLFKGGAKFSPMEAGLSLCWVPVPGQYREYETTKEKEAETGGKQNQTVGFGDIKDNKEVIRFQDATTRAEHSGRYGLMDEASEFLGRCATKRIVRLTQPEALRLLDTGSLSLPSSSNTKPLNRATQSDISTAKPGIEDLHEWSMGAVIAVAACGWVDKEQTKPSTLFMPCVLKEEDQQSGERCFNLLAEQRLTDAWKRLLEATMARAS